MRLRLREWRRYGFAGGCHVRAYPRLLTSENAAALDLIDHQVGLVTGSRLFNGELKHNVVALTPPFRGTAVSRLQRPDSHICDVYRRDREWPLYVDTGRPWPKDTVMV